MGLAGGLLSGSWRAWECPLALAQTFVTSRICRCLWSNDLRPAVLAWTKGLRFGTVNVDLKRHEVVDLLPDRAVSSMAKWFKDHPGAELISRDRAGIYADGAPQARQVAKT